MVVKENLWIVLVQKRPHSVREGRDKDGAPVLWRRGLWVRRRGIYSN